MKIEKERHESPKEIHAVLNKSPSGEEKMRQITAVYRAQAQLNVQSMS